MLLGFVLYAHWDGGSVGDWLAKAFAWLIGEARLGVPVALAGAGALLWMRPLLSTIKPFRAGALLLFGAGALALAGNGPRARLLVGQLLPRPRRHRRPGRAVGSPRGCSARRGAHILAVFLALAGVVLLSGGSLAAWIRHGGPARSPARRATAARRGAAAQGGRSG